MIHCKIFLLPRSFQLVGILFFIVGLLLGFARLKYGFKPDLLDAKVFALSSSYLETKYLQVIRNNMCEELAALLVLMGLFLMAFVREKDECELFNVFRLKAFFVAVYLNVLFLIFALLFTYGFAFIYMLIVNMGLGLLVYKVVFQILVYQYRKRTTM